MPRSPTIYNRTTKEILHRFTQMELAMEYSTSRPTPPPPEIAIGGIGAIGVSGHYDLRKFFSEKFTIY